MVAVTGLHEPLPGVGVMVRVSVGPAVRVRVGLVLSVGEAVLVGPVP